MASQYSRIFIVLWTVIAVITSAASETHSDLKLKKRQDQNDAPFPIQFFAYTRVNSSTPREIIFGNNGTVQGLDTTKDIKYFCHGFTDSSTSPLSQSVKDALLSRLDVTVIMVDWRNGSAGPDYEGASQRALVTGARIAQVILWMETQGFSRNLVHLIGFSLGCQVVGAAGRDVTNPKLPRITGLDPSYEFFRNADLNGLLDPSDANFVDIIHSNSGDFNTGHVSFLAPVGHQDYYINGGERQPGCYVTIGRRLVAADRYEMFDFCSHSFAVRVFVNSLIERIPFIAHSCASYDAYTRGLCTCYYAPYHVFGYFAHPRNGNGSFYVATRSTAPYPGRQLFTRLTLSSNQLNTTGILRLTLQDRWNSLNTDEAEILNGETQLRSSTTVYSAIAVNFNIRRFYTGQLRFDVDPRTNDTVPLSVRNLEIKDQLNRRVCSGAVLVPRNTTVQIRFRRCY